MSLRATSAHVCRLPNSAWPLSPAGDSWQGTGEGPGNRWVHGFLASWAEQDRYGGFSAHKDNCIPWTFKF